MALINQGRRNLIVLVIAIALTVVGGILSGLSKILQ